MIIDAGFQARRHRGFLKLLNVEVDMLHAPRALDAISTDTAERSELIALAYRMYHARRRRERRFPPSILGEPAWDMLLALYCMPSRAEYLSMTALCYTTNAANTTALRWAGILHGRGLITRLQDPWDRRRFYVGLSTEGDELVTAYLRDVRSSFDGAA